MVKIKNLLHVSTLRLDDDDNVVASNDGKGDDVTIQWVDPAARTAYLSFLSGTISIGIDWENNLMGAIPPKLFKLELQPNGSYRIKAVGDDVNVVVLNKAGGPVTNEPVATSAVDFSKQFWNFV